MTRILQTVVLTCLITLFYSTLAAASLQADSGRWVACQDLLEPKARLNEEERAKLTEKIVADASTPQLQFALESVRSRLRSYETNWSKASIENGWTENGWGQPHKKAGPVDRHLIIANQFSDYEKSEFIRRVMPLIEGRHMYTIGSDYLAMTPEGVWLKNFADFSTDDGPIIRAELSNPLLPGLLWNEIVKGKNGRALSLLKDAIKGFLCCHNVNEPSPLVIFLDLGGVARQFSYLEPTVVTVEEHDYILNPELTDFLENMTKKYPRVLFIINGYLNVVRLNYPHKLKALRIDSDNRSGVMKPSYRPPEQRSYLIEGQPLELVVVPK